MVRLLGKKAQFVDLAIFLTILIALTAIMGSAISSGNDLVQIGAKEFSMLSAYAEGEKATEYLKLAGEMALVDVAKDYSTARTLTAGKIVSDASPKINNYISLYKSSNPKFTVEFPAYTYTALNQIDTNSLITITGFSDENIVIKSADYKFTYSLNGNFRSAVSNDKLNKLNSSRIG